MKKTLGAYIARRPRTGSAVAFGVMTLAVVHFAWIPDARMNGLTPYLTSAAGLAHALAGAITGPRLVDRTRTRNLSQAALLGAGTSLLALAVFAPLLAGYLFATDIRPASALSYAALPVLIAVFAFLAAGWALLAVSMGVGWALHWVVTDQKAV